MRALLIENLEGAGFRTVTRNHLALLDVDFGCWDLRGSQYTSEAFQRLMAEHGVTCSLSRSGNVWDNAAIESFFSSLEVERVARKTYRTRDQARADVFDYIERFYTRDEGIRRSAI